ncbi:hypothetical protein AUK10_00830 [Candidatus Gracilibacteria bacterium CG2_30_37_12]|nr:MAG: hypothetical protein AUK10_00830 [Candidatus Gracilibacteria bacterium CG2_30_37_12]
MTEFKTQAERFSTMVQTSPDGENGKIDAVKAVYHRIREIKKAVGIILGREKIKITGNILLMNLRHGVGVLARAKTGSTVEYAITKTGAQDLFEFIAGRNKKTPGIGEINLPASVGDGTHKTKGYGTACAYD